MGAQTFIQQLGQYPAPWLYEFDAWYLNRINYLAAYCKVPRAATYYIAESPTGSGVYSTTTAITLGTPINFTITDQTGNLVGQGVM